MTREEKRLADANQGRVAQVAWGFLEPMLDAQRTAAFSLMIHSFRAGEEPRATLAHVATLSALAELEQMIKTTIARGERAGRESLDG